jgi:hypothetical protein
LARSVGTSVHTPVVTANVSGSPAGTAGAAVSTTQGREN